MSEEDYDYDNEIRLDPSPDCPYCMNKLVWEEDLHRFYCHTCCEPVALCQVYNWHMDGKPCLFCGALTQVHLGTVMACFHLEEAHAEIHIPICAECALKPIDELLETLQENDYYHSFAEDKGFEIGPHPKTHAEHQGGLTFYV